MSAPTEGAVFRLFPTCVPVRGARRSTVCDLERGRYHLIPNGLYEILTVHRGRTPAEIRAAYGPESHEAIDEYFAFLEREELGFWCSEGEEFPEIDLTWERPETVTNAIIDVGVGSRHDFAGLLAQLDDLGCRALQIRFFREAGIGELDRLLTLTDAGRLRSVELLAPHASDLSLERLEELSRSHPRLGSVFVHSAPRTERIARGGLTVCYRTERITSASHCGEVHPGYFVVNLGSFAEARRFNSCLNRKLSVDEHGEIRNCPAMPASYGNAADTSLHSAVMRRDFREVWEVNKDQIETCKDCEFRYVCTDCRAFVRDASDRLSKPSTCTYDPYSGEWVPRPRHLDGPRAGAVAAAAS